MRRERLPSRRGSRSTRAGTERTPRGGISWARPERADERIDQGDAPDDEDHCAPWVLVHEVELDIEGPAYAQEQVEVRKRPDDRKEDLLDYIGAEDSGEGRAGDDRREHQEQRQRPEVRRQDPVERHRRCVAREHEPEARRRIGVAQDRVPGERRSRCLQRLQRDAGHEVPERDLAHRVPQVVQPAADVPTEEIGRRADHQDHEPADQQAPPVRVPALLLQRRRGSLAHFHPPLILQVRQRPSSSDPGDARPSSLRQSRCGMCRWLAYSGSPVLLQELLYGPKNSLIVQSLHSRLGAEETNGDGFGVGWYGAQETPAVFRSVEPAWNDRNLRELADHVTATTVFAHIRASTGSPVQQTNCHPFRHGRWLWMHNGVIHEYQAVKREHAVEYPFQGTIATTNGESIWAFRYSSEGKSRSLFFSTDVSTLRALYPENELLRRLDDESRLIVSEPLGDELPGAWNEVPESSWGVIKPGQDELHEFTPAADFVVARQ